MLHLLLLAGSLLPVVAMLGSLLAAARLRESRRREAPARRR